MEKLKLLTIMELGSELGVSHTTIYKWVNEKACPYTVGADGKRQFDLDEVKRWYDKTIQRKYKS